MNQGAMAEFLYSNQWLSATVPTASCMGTNVQAAGAAAAAIIGHHSTSMPSSSSNTSQNAPYFDYHTAYSECVNELNQAMQTTKSQKLRDLITTCITRLQQLQEFSDTVVKRCHSLEDQLRHSATCPHSYGHQQAPANFSTFPVEEPSIEHYFYQARDHPGVAHRTSGHQQESTHRAHSSHVSSQPDHQEQPRANSSQVSHQHKRQNNAASSKISSHKSSSNSNVVQNSMEHPSSPLQKHPKDPHYYRNIAKRNDSIEKLSEEAPEFNPSFERLQFDKDELAREALHRAATHDFGDLMQRYSYQAIMDMVDSAARESIKNFQTHGMLEQFSDPSNPKRPSCRCKEPGCGVVFGNYISALLHCLKKHMNQFKPCACTKCDAKFFLKIKLRYHYSKHTNVYRLRCPHEGCNYVCNRRMELKFHVLGHDQQNKKYECPECGRRIINSQNLNRHRRRHQGVQFPCDWEGCDKVFYAKPLLKQHRKAHEDLAAEKHKCRFCGHVSPTSYNLINHMRAKHDYPTPLSQNERIQRPRTERIICEKCGKSILKYTYKRHLRKWCGQNKGVKTKQPPKRKVPPKEPSTCPYCNNVVSKPALTKHIKKYHSDQCPTVPRHKNMVKCSVCKVDFEDKSFKAHFTKTHPDLDYYPGRGIKQLQPDTDSEATELDSDQDLMDDEYIPKNFSKRDNYSGLKRRRLARGRKKAASSKSSKGKATSRSIKRHYSDSDDEDEDEKDGSDEDWEDEEEVDGEDALDGFSQRRRKIAAIRSVLNSKSFRPTTSALTSDADSQSQSQSQSVSAITIKQELDPELFNL